MRWPECRNGWIQGETEKGGADNKKGMGWSRGGREMGNRALADVQY